MSLSEATSLASSPLPPLSRAVVSFALIVATWELRLRTRKHLQNLPPHMLRDIGVDVTDAAIEAEKPFWRG